MLESWVSIPLTIFWIVGVTNAINLIDGLDGLATGVSGIAIGTILVMAVLMGNTTVALFCLRRRQHYRVPVLQLSSGQDFHGDTGSLFLGFCLAMLSLLDLNRLRLYPSLRR